MPLRALVEGREVHVWDLTREDWAALKRRSRAEEPGAVRMACCGRHGTAKTSRNGNPFFAHRTGPSPNTVDLGDDQMGARFSAEGGPCASHPPMERGGLQAVALAVGAA